MKPDTNEDFVDEDERAYRLVHAKIEAMTPEEGQQSLIDAGIISEDGKLTRQYGGDGEPSEYYKRKTEWMFGPRPKRAR